MCGISGISWVDEELISRMNFINRHRGPDDEGFFCDGKMTLGHRRLSILDLSSSGRQPMFNEDSSLCIVYNGEIYNSPELRDGLERAGHTFKSRTDTEAIIHSCEEYGLENSLNLFNGMWAFCLYDIKRQSLTLARDRFGVKPLYYTVMDDGRIAFSSMISALKILKPKWEPNHKAIMRFTAFNILHDGEETFYKGINILPPGHILEYSLAERKPKLKCWYEFAQRSLHSSPEETVRELFLDAVKLRTLSDVPVGSCLSGGLDSSSIVCALDKILEPSFKTFSLTIPGHSLDESRYVNIVGDATRIERRFLTPSPDSLASDMDSFLQAQEEPVLNLSVFAQYKLMQLASSHGAKLLLDGQGGDEIFAGYQYYWAYQLRRQLLSFNLESFKRDAIGLLKSPNCSLPFKMLAFTFLPDMLKLGIFRHLDSPWIDWGFLRSVGAGCDKRWSGMNLDEALRLTLRETSIPHLLLWEDKNSMRWHIETRLPFLDYRLVESAASIPPDKKMVAGRSKAVFRDAMKGLVPDEILERKEKIGFAMPESSMFETNSAKKLIAEAFDSQSFLDRPYWNARLLKPRLEAAASGRHSGLRSGLFKFLSLELWLERNF